MSGKHLFSSSITIIFFVLVSLTAQAQENEKAPQTPAQAESTAEAPTSVTVTLGDQKIVLPAPEGFVEPARIHPGYRKVGESLTPPTLKFLALFIPSDDFETQNPDWATYILVETFQSKDAQIPDPATFKEAKEAFRKQFANLETKAFQDLLNQRNQARNDKLKKEHEKDIKVTIRQPVSLGVLEENDSFITFGLLAPVSATTGGKTENELRVAAASLLPVKGHGIIVYAYRRYEALDDITTLKDLSLQAVRKILEANKN